MTPRRRNPSRSGSCATCGKAVEPTYCGPTCLHLAAALQIALSDHRHALHDGPPDRVPVTEWRVRCLAAVVDVIAGDEEVHDAAAEIEADVASGELVADPAWFVDMAGKSLKEWIKARAGL